MNTVAFEENHFFCQHLAQLLIERDFKTFECLLADHGWALTDYIDATAAALMPPPDLTSYYHAVQQFINTGELK